MAKKPAKASNGKNRSLSRAPAPIASTPVRNSAVPKKTTSSPKALLVTHETIAKRAYEISQSPLCGSESDNWLRAERELKGL